MMVLNVSTTGISSNRHEIGCSYHIKSGINNSTVILSSTKETQTLDNGKMTLGKYIFLIRLPES